ncbi:hypothetical protein U6G28_02420 [Actinomycetaceae bacterium MB13-C1-2]|nr:hypothetical protein U6G28_02420 [Actinomycetaceae bacterium MB13-C1-2]
MKTHSEWFLDTVGSDTTAAAAKRADLAHNSLGRQLDKDSIPAESVIKLARAYHVNPVQALVDTGYIDAEESRGPITVINWDEVTDAQLLEELLGRANRGSQIMRQPLDSETVEEIEVQADEDGPANLTAQNVHVLDFGKGRVIDGRGMAALRDKEGPLDGQGADDIP